ncbi:hypothetical protein [Kutzneria buriramensis]|uniref:Uncharacterized protein n=1 Tax=Kutzneria buriramensis TaxID=1045776 RepID=A0A3E0IB45_9PSEU|nr:hypothetical protein [Kutzneria buriramensis]REH55859.1 hypothetical protein BCF44_101885 [Kutzneria buriramensis]
MNETTLLTIAAALVGDERIGDEGSWQQLRVVVGAKVDVTAAGIEQVAGQLAQACADDEAFAAKLAAVWEVAARGRGHGVLNVALGTPTGTLFQAGSISGSVVMSSPEPEPKPKPEPKPARERRDWFTFRRPV